VRSITADAPRTHSSAPSSLDAFTQKHEELDSLFQDSFAVVFYPHLEMPPELTDAFNHETACDALPL
jgi:hypothetical protein